MPSKTLTIYTSTDNPAKVLKAATQILLTLTPVDQSELFKSQTPVAWQVLAFAPRRDAMESVQWHSGIGFCNAAVSEDNIVKPNISVSVDVGKMAALENVAGTYQWSDTQSRDSSSAAEVVEAINVSGVPKALALCSVHGETYDPVVYFGSKSNNGKVVVGAPVMLQAYAVSKYKKGEMLRAESQEDFVFTDWKKRAQPINAISLSQDTTWILYSDPSGKVKLEKVD